MRKLNNPFFLLLCLLTLTLPIATAAVPHLINYQGRLTDKANKPLDGQYAITFRIFDAENAGNLLWEETHSNVTIQKGIFSILLGSAANLNLPFDKQYYLEIKVGTEVISPRQTIASSGYAINSEKAEDANAVNGISASVTPAANKILPLDGNAKLPVTALKTFDSGWFVVTNNANYTVNHNLGTTKVLITWWFSIDSGGNNAAITAAGQNDWYQPGGGSHHQGSSLNHLTTTSVTLSTFGDDAFTWMDSSGGLSSYGSGYARIIMLALE